jgi:hypothetical protein
MYKTLLKKFPSDIVKYCIIPYLFPDISITKDKHIEVLEELHANFYEVFRSYRADRPEVINYRKYYRKYEANGELCKCISDPKYAISFSHCFFYLRKQEIRDEINEKIKAITRIMNKLRIFGIDKNDDYFAIRYFQHLKLHKNFFKYIN